MNQNRNLLLLLNGLMAVAIMGLAFACGSGGADKYPETAGPGPGPATEVTFAGDIAPLLADNCAICHTGPSGSALPAGLDLKAGQAYDSIVNVDSIQVPSMKRVATGDSANSYLYRKLVGDQDSVGGTGAKMPLGRSLPGTQIEAVKNWIESGAKNN